MPSNPWAYDQPQDVVTSLRRSLRGIGLELVVEKLDDLESRIAAPGAAWDLFLFEWGQDYPDPSATLNHLFETGYPAADGVTLSALHLADRAYDGDLRAAARLSGRARLDAYARLDERLSRAGSAVIPIGRRDQLDSFSERVGCQTYHPLYGIVLGALCLRR
jgi:ABC-type oligopeptide transport system substrate-binding subunit